MDIKTATMHVTMEQHSIHCETLPFLKKSVSKLKMVFESSLQHKLAQLPVTVGGYHRSFAIMDT